MSGGLSFAESQALSHAELFSRRIFREIVCAVQQGILLPRGSRLALPKCNTWRKQQRRGLSCAERTTRLVVTVRRRDVGGTADTGLKARCRRAARKTKEMHDTGRSK